MEKTACGALDAASVYVRIYMHFAYLKIADIPGGPCRIWLETIRFPNDGRVPRILYFPSSVPAVHPRPNLDPPAKTTMTVPDGLRSSGRYFCVCKGFRDNNAIILDFFLRPVFCEPSERINNFFFFCK